jgi:putative addiction module killer protein
MLTLLKSKSFDDWLSGLRDRQARARVQARIDRLAMGNPGDVKPTQSGISELRIDYGPGYRVYYHQRGKTIVLLCRGGDKRTQDAYIRRAVEIAKNWKG